MTRLVALYKRPPEPEEFDKHFLSVHVPLLKQVGGLKQMDITRVTGAPMGEAKFHFLVLLTFETMNAMNLALASKEGKAVVRDLMAFAPDLVTVFYGEKID